MKVFDQFLEVISKKGCVYAVLIDPDLKNNENIESNVKSVNESEVDVLFVGGSLIMDSKLMERIDLIKKYARIPVVFFPGSASQLSSSYDAILFMSLISGRNPHYLIGEQVIAAPVIKDLGIETIPTGYIILESGNRTTVEFMSGTKPIPRQRPDITIAHALAGQYLGMKLIYLEAGSGAKIPVEIETINQVSKAIDIPLVVGGGIKNPEDAAERAKAGASIIVTGTCTEEDPAIMRKIADAVHWRNN
tara:strand:- start:2169 stop:2912 length:744 start_codon:yes stop_codon:yes gene_type:complete